MTQQQMSKLLDVSDRTLRDWKSNRNRLYTLLENLDYNEVKNKIDVVDLNDEVEFNPQEFSVNLFWQTNQRSHQKVYSIISNYLSTMNQDDIKTLCNKFGKNTCLKCSFPRCARRHRVEVREPRTRRRRDVCSRSWVRNP